MKNNERKEKKEYVVPKMEILEMECTKVLMASGEKYTEDGGSAQSLMLFE